MPTKVTGRGSAGSLVDEGAQLDTLRPEKADDDGVADLLGVQLRLKQQPPFGIDQANSTPLPEPTDARLRLEGPSAVVTVQIPSPLAQMWKKSSDFLSALERARQSRGIKTESEG
ncbi:MAG: hypothetical protein ACFB21_04830 [Opitutales bacterium]